MSDRQTRKAKLFIENFVIFGIGGVINKMIPLIMLPIITRLMPDTAYFGISDLSNTVVQFGSAMAVIGMYDAMYRLFFEKEDSLFRKKVCSTTITFTAVLSLLITVIMVCCKEIIARIFFGDIKYSFLVYIAAITTLVSATNQIISAPTRMQNKRRIYLITNALGPALAYLISLPLILKGHYLIALPLASLISGASIEITFGILNRKWFSIHLFDKKLLKQLLVIAIPLLPNFLIYWIFNSSDKIMIANILNIGESGIYSVGSKLGHASQLIYTAFAGGWQYFAFSTMKDGNQVESNSKIFEYLGIISFIATSFICAWSYGIFKLLFKADYLRGYIVAPYLFLAPLLQMLFQIAANQFMVIKKTWPNLFILLAGAILNLIINYFLIPVLGIEGASLATLLGYIASDIICIIVLCHMKLMIITKKFIIASITLAGYVIVWRLFFNDSILVGNIGAIAFTIDMLLLYKNDFCKDYRKKILYR